jgi:hypothetical protein
MPCGLSARSIRQKQKTFPQQIISGSDPGRSPRSKGLADLGGTILFYLHVHPEAVSSKIKGMLKEVHSEVLNFSRDSGINRIKFRIFKMSSIPVGKDALETVSF